MKYRYAEPGDIPAIASLFLTAFEPSVNHFLGKAPTNRLCLEDIFAFILKAEPKCFFVATDGTTLTGYIIASRDMRAIWLKSLTTGTIFIWLLRWATGRYGIGTRPIKAIISHKLLFLTSKHNYRNTSQAQILSFAIHPTYQCQGIGKNLLQMGLDYLHDVNEIKLEVRPYNKPAFHLYKSHGFQPIATTSDSQGDWLVMVRKLK